jgi:hypothetical protein
MRSRDVRIDAARAVHARVARQAGSTDIDLRHRWKCTSRECLNQYGHCFINSDTPPQHYRLDDIHIGQWSGQITHGLATIEKPPKKMLKALYLNGPVSDKRETEKKKSKPVDTMATALQATMASAQEMIAMSMSMTVITSF